MRSLESGVKRGEKNFIDNLIIFKHKTMKKEQSIDVIKRIERLERKVEEIRWNSLEDYQKQNETPYLFSYSYYFLKLNNNCNSIKYPFF